MLKGTNVSKYFGGLAAINNVDFFIEEEEIAGLIGPNGAGKTTLFNVITGVYRPTVGRITFYEKDIVDLRPHEICKLGIARTFQLVRPFLNLTVLENVTVGGLYGRSNNISINEAQKEALKYIEFVGLSDKNENLVKNLTLFDKKRVEVATALNTNPKLLLLDEFIAGLNPTEILQAMKMIKEIRDEVGITVFWIEHVMRALMSVADRIMVLHHGEKIAEGTPKEIGSNQKVIDAYLGGKSFF